MTNELQIGDLVILVDDVSEIKQYGFVIDTYTVNNEEIYLVRWFGEGTTYPYYFNEITKVS